MQLSAALIAQRRGKTDTNVALAKRIRSSESAAARKARYGSDVVVAQLYE